MKRIGMLAVFILSCNLMFSQAYLIKGTAIVFRINKEYSEIAIGADSQSILDVPNLPSQYFYRCKIGIHKNIAFVATGWQAPNFDQIVREAIDSNETISQFLKSFKQKYFIHLNTTLRKIRTYDSVKYNNTILNARIGTYTFAYFEGDSVRIKPLIFQFDGSQADTIRFAISEPILELTPGPISLFDGVWLNVSPEEDNDSLWSKGYVSAMTHLINLQAKSTPRLVGGSVDILLLKKNMHKWIQNENNCEVVRNLTQ